jgi:hypothetical protein
VAPRAEHVIVRIATLSVALALAGAAAADNRARCADDLPIASDVDGGSGDTRGAPLERCAGTPCETPCLAPRREASQPFVREGCAAVATHVLASLEAPEPPTPPPRSLRSAFVGAFENASAA